MIATTSQTRHLRCQRTGFTLIELITAMLSSVVLIVALASAIMISSRLLESTSHDRSDSIHRDIADRIAADLRYSTNDDDNSGYGFNITRPNPSTGSSEAVNYELYLNGTVRSVAGGASMQLSPEAPGYQSFVDGYSAATYVDATNPVRVRSTSSAGNGSPSNSIIIDTPANCKSGDLMMICVAARTPNSIQFSNSGWVTQQAVGYDDLRLLIATQTYHSSWPSSVTISVDTSSGIAASILAIENANSASPVTWSSSRGGYAWWFHSGSHPSAYEQSADYDSEDLNVQVVVADSHPWPSNTFGMAGFVTASQATASASNFANHTAIAIAIRSGESPGLSFTPRMLHQQSGYWLQTGLRVEDAP